ncbi:MAG: HEAT repeat domain-containing protein [Nitrospirales bacterium]|nr:HEAT repeat domain-containing protein [Nitrospirales bacterium]
MTEINSSALLFPSDSAVGIEASELQAVKQLLALLDKTFKTTRTYGPNNPVAQKFFQQFYDYLTIQLAAHDVLQFLAQRSELLYNGVAVYQSTSSSENLAFKLHADGIRELSFHKGLSQEDLAYFLEALWGTYDSETSDDDIVTRLWEKNLSTISFVTAEEIVQSADAMTVLTPQESHTLNSLPSELRHIAGTEAARSKKGTPRPTGSQGQGGPAVYEISPEEQKLLLQEINCESARDNTTYLLDMLTAILASEKSNILLNRLLELFGDILTTLLRDGNWKLLNTFVSLLYEAQELCPNLSDQHKAKLAALFNSLGHPNSINAMETALNACSNTSLDDLQALLLMLNPSTAHPLCTLMANLKHKSHRMMVCDVLTTHAKQNPSLLMRGLTDSRWYVVRNLIYIMGKLGHEQFVKHLEPVFSHEDVRVRKETVRTLRTICPSGIGNPFISFLNDAEQSIRHLALKVLLNGPYTATLAAWTRIVDHKSFHDRSVSEKKAIFRAMRQTAGEETIPYWHRLLTRRSWINRRRLQEDGLLAAEALGAMGTPAAMLALKTGQRRFNRTIRKACTDALVIATKRATFGNQTP